MCDFRQIKKIKITRTNEIVDIDYVPKHLTFEEEKLPQSPGLYHVGASGCGYEYYDGSKWLHEYVGDYEVIECHKSVATEAGLHYPDLDMTRLGVPYYKDLDAKPYD